MAVGEPKYDGRCSVLQSTQCFFNTRSWLWIKINICTSGIRTQCKQATCIFLLLITKYKTDISRTRSQYNRLTGSLVLRGWALVFHSRRFFFFSGHDQTHTRLVLTYRGRRSRPGEINERIGKKMASFKLLMSYTPSYWIANYTPGEEVECLDSPPTVTTKKKQFGQFFLVPSCRFSSSAMLHNRFMQKTKKFPSKSYNSNKGETKVALFSSR